MRIIAVANQKGGCGKTTTAINLSSALVSKGQKILLIDCDPQAHATMGLNVKPSDLESSMYNVITPKENERLSLSDVKVPLKDRFDLAPSSVILSAVEQELSGVEGREEMLTKALQSVNGTYDYIIIDCPPSIGLLSFNALRAAEEVIIPIDMSLFSLRGIAKLLEIVLLLKDELGHEITSRALITMYDYRTRYSRRVFEKVKEQFGEDVFETVIRYNIRLRETVDYGLPIVDYDKHAIGSKDYQDLAEEIIGSGAAERLQEKAHAERKACDVLQKTEEYIDSLRNFPEDVLSRVESDETNGNSFSSSYAKMIQAIVADPISAIPEDETD